MAMKPEEQAKAKEIVANFKDLEEKLQTASEEKADAFRVAMGNFLAVPGDIERDGTLEKSKPYLKLAGFTYPDTFERAEITVEGNQSRYVEAMNDYVVMGDANRDRVQELWKNRATPTESNSSQQTPNSKPSASAEQPTATPKATPTQTKKPEAPAPQDTTSSFAASFENLGKASEAAKASGGSVPLPNNAKQQHTPLTPGRTQTQAGENKKEPIAAITMIATWLNDRQALNATDIKNAITAYNAQNPPVHTFRVTQEGNPVVITNENGDSITIKANKDTAEIVSTIKPQDIGLMYTAGKAIGLNLDNVDIHVPAPENGRKRAQVTEQGEIDIQKGFKAFQDFQQSNPSPNQAAPRRLR